MVEDWVNQEVYDNYCVMYIYYDLYFVYLIEEFDWIDFESDEFVSVDVEMIIVCGDVFILLICDEYV